MIQEQRPGLRLRLVRIYLCAAILMLAGCDNQGRPVEEAGLDRLAKGISSESDVRMVMGHPEVVWEDESGRRTLQYPKGPEGARTWSFVIDRDGKLQDYEQILTPENFARVSPGMSKQEVRQLLGKPKSIVQFRLKKEEVWDWKYLDGSATKFFNVHFDIETGKVSRTSTSEPITD